MSNTPSLLPCPFCGGINIIHCGHHMYCHACGADGPDADSQHESEARSAWNRRTPQPVVREPLTNEQRMEVFNEAMKRCDENLNLPWRVAILEQVEAAHGITQKGGSNAK